MHQILDRLPDSHQLPHVPTQLWLILSLEICVRDAFGTYLLLTYPSYGITTPATEGYWAPPFLGYPVEAGYSMPETVGAVRSLFEETARKVDVANAIHHLAYLLGLSNAQIQDIGSFTELKSSPRSPHQAKCYRINRFQLKSVSARNLRNLADPECRKGYVFLPLSAVAEGILRRRGDRDEGWFYLGKPIMTNVKVVLQDDDHCRSMNAAAITLPPEMFYREENGLLICADLAGFGKACQYATAQMHTFDSTGQEIATRFRESVAAMFYEFLCKIGIQQVHMAGDGFLAAIPEAHYDGGLEQTLSTLLDSYADVLCRVAALNTCIVDASHRIGSRLAIHWGRYRFGRIALARSFTADFDGAAVVEVARLEQGLAAATKGQSTGPGALATVVGIDNTIAVTCEVAHQTAELLGRRPELSMIGEMTLLAKESSLSAQIFEVRVGARK
jgi:hypothetical protein